MREEIRNTWIQAQEDFKTAQVLLETGRFYASVFFSQQAAEKALKALWMEARREMPRTHNLVALARALNAPESVLEAARELTPDYVITRYANAAHGVPAEMYSQQSAQAHLDYAAEVLEWTRKQWPESSVS
ncbi:MAG: HEPN domain-containing protein [Anaerolineae bacterium]|jgi:HEPN domain-containing protein